MRCRGVVEANSFSRCKACWLTRTMGSQATNTSSCVRLTRIFVPRESAMFPLLQRGREKMGRLLRKKKRVFLQKALAELRKPDHAVPGCHIAKCLLASL